MATADTNTNNHFSRFDDEVASGPVPVFFSNKPDESLQELKRDPSFAFKCLQALVSRLLVRKEMTKEEAIGYLAKPEESAI